MRQTGFIYFITPEAIFHREEESLKRVKIGFTAGSPLARMRSLQTGSPVTLELLGYIDGTQALERAFHEVFADLRFCGEWFAVEGKLSDFLYYFHSSEAFGGHIDRERLTNSIHDNLFARTSSHPSMTDEYYLSTANPAVLSRWFPEAVQ